MSGMDEALGDLVSLPAKASSALGALELFRLMQMRRSCRAFTDDPLARDVLEDLVRFGITAPTGTNSQAWTFSIAPDRTSVLELAGAVARSFRELNELARRPVVRLASRLVIGERLERYYREHYESVKSALKDWDERRVDRLFWGAPAVIAVASRREASCPAEDALLASAHIVLGAQVLGLGTCHIGFAVAAMARDPRVAECLGVPKHERVHAVIAVGHPRRTYHRPAGRCAPIIRFGESV